MGYVPPRRPSQSQPLSADEDARIIARSLGAEAERFLEEDRAIAEFKFRRRARQATQSDGPR